MNNTTPVLPPAHGAKQPPPGLVRLIAAVGWIAWATLALAALCSLFRFTVTDETSLEALNTVRHDIMVFGFGPEATLAAVLLLFRKQRAIHSAFARQVLTVLAMVYGLTVVVLGVAHALLFPGVVYWPFLTNEVIAAVGLGLLVPVFFVREVRQTGRHVLPTAEGIAQDLDTPASRQAIDASCRVVLTWLASATFWLLAGSLLALLASVKLHSPYFLGDVRWLTFGRVRPAHLNTMILGWGSMAGIGVSLWLQARLARTLLPFRELLYVGAYYWNAAVALGTYELLAGNSTGVEWLEFPVYVAVPLSLVFILLFLCSVQMLLSRRSKHIYVSQWYLFGSMFWFPFLYLAAVLVIFIAPISGDIKAVANWWFAHNVLGLWLTPIGLASAYYFIPKVLGRPVHSYYLSILGFWSLALFYNWNGTHHLIGGPLSAWLVTLGVVGSMMMVVPVITVAINHHFTMIGHFHRLKSSPTLRFTVFAAMSYTLVSLQGSLTALRTVNVHTHFTHYTIAHAHLGVYAFYTMMMFGAIYYIGPRLTGQEWYSARLIKVHFWASAVGITLYFVPLTWGGIGQGTRMLNPDIPFLEVVAYTLPYLHLRSLAGILLTIGHIAFALSMRQLVRGRGAPLGDGPTLLHAHASSIEPGGVS